MCRHLHQCSFVSGKVWLSIANKMGSSLSLLLFQESKLLSNPGQQSAYLSHSRRRSENIGDGLNPFPEQHPPPNSFFNLIFFFITKVVRDHNKNTNNEDTYKENDSSPFLRLYFWDQPLWPCVQSLERCQEHAQAYKQPCGHCCVFSTAFYPSLLSITSTVLLYQRSQETPQLGQSIVSSFCL